VDCCLSMWLSGKSSWGGVCCVSMTKAGFRRTSNQPPKVLDAREIVLHETGRQTRCEQIQWPDLYPTATDQLDTLGLRSAALRSNIRSSRGLRRSGMVKVKW
jgi:hypothetical protein